METKADFSAQLLGAASALSGGSIPVAFVRGDREAKGEFAPLLRQYLPSATDGLYDAFNFGSLSAVLLDTGTGEADSGEPTPFSAYLAREDKWIRSLKEADFSGRYKLVFRHIPQGASFSRYPWNESFAQMGFGAVISSHSHTAKRLESDEISVFTLGGKQLADIWLTMITLKGGKIALSVTNTIGRTVFSDEATRTQE